MTTPREEDNKDKRINKLKKRETIFEMIYIVFSMMIVSAVLVSSLDYFTSLNKVKQYASNYEDYIGIMTGCGITFILLSYVFLKARSQVRKDIKNELSDSERDDYDFNP